MDNLLGINGYSVPALTPTSEGLRVFVANETGTVQDFGLASDNWDAELLEVNDAVFGGREGFRCAAAIADVDNDGLLDALVGIQNGGLLAYSSSTDTAIVDAGFLPAWEWQVMPNPGRDAFRWECPTVVRRTHRVECDRQESRTRGRSRATGRRHGDLRLGAWHLCHSSGAHPRKQQGRPDGNALDLDQVARINGRFPKRLRGSARRARA